MKGMLNSYPILNQRFCSVGINKLISCNIIDVLVI